MEEPFDRKRTERRYFALTALVCVVTGLVNYSGTVRSYNTTMLALSYRFGLTSRSLLGAIYHGLDDLLPVDLFSYRSAQLFALLVTAGCFLIFLAFARDILRMCRPGDLPVCGVLLILFALASVSTFTFAYNYLRVDICMLTASLAALWLLMRRRAVWLVPVFSILGVMFHQGYVFMYFSPVLVILFYRAFREEEKSRRRGYAILFLVSFLACSALFLWFEFFSRANGTDFFETVEAEAKAVSNDGIYHTTLLYHEVLGIDLSGYEKKLTHVNHVQLPLFLIAFCPYLILIGRFFTGLLRRVGKGVSMLPYLALAVGWMTLLPNFLLKIDYGRWLMAFTAYMLLVMVCLLAMQDPFACEQFSSQAQKMKENPAALLLLVYLVLLLPFLDLDIDPLAQDVGQWLNDHLLHYYLPFP